MWRAVGKEWNLEQKNSEKTRAGMRGVGERYTNQMNARAKKGEKRERKEVGRRRKDRRRKKLHKYTERRDERGRLNIENEKRGKEMDVDGWKREDELLM